VTGRPAASAALLTAAVLVLSGCGGGSSSTPGAGSPGTSGSSATSASSDGSPSSSSSGAVQGVTLTPQGTKLSLGKAARVSWQPSQKKTGVIRLAVTKLEKVPISVFHDWRLDPATSKSTPYYVHVSVTNLGTTPLSGVPVPLYLLDGRNTLLEASTFRARFPACPSTPLPARFTHGKHIATCLVYFAPNHGKLVAMSFRPSQDFDAITWTGPVTSTGKKKH
jgi:hypothetical protein